MSADLLKTSEPFAGLSDAELRLVAALGRPRRVRADEVLFHIGDDADTFYVIERGRIELTVPLVVLGQPNDVRFQTLEPGRALAWSALVPPHKMTTSARATVESELYGFDRRALGDLFAREPRIGLVTFANLAGIIGTRLHETHALWVREVQRHVARTYR